VVTSLALPSILCTAQSTTTDYRKFNKSQNNHRTPERETINLALL
jgi:hypothetical protein